MSADSSINDYLGRMLEASGPQVNCGSCGAKTLDKATPHCTSCGAENPGFEPTAFLIAQNDTIENARKVHAIDSDHNWPNDEDREEDEKFCVICGAHLPPLPQKA